MREIKFIRKFLKKIVQIVIVLCVTILLFDLAYRNSIIDFYKSELVSLNTGEDLNSKTIDFLVFGDSFTAWENNYVSNLKNLYPKKSFINSSISGIGIKEVNTFAEKRIEKYEPKNIIYQVYVGNDLIDVRHLQNWQDLSFARNVYWKASNYLPSIIYLNKKLKHFKKDRNYDTSKMQLKGFKLSQYNEREKLLIKANSEYLYNSFNIEGSFKIRYDIWKKELNDFLELVPDETNVYIVFIPHCAQLNEYYYNNMLDLGAHFRVKEKTLTEDYVFFTNVVSDFKDNEHVTFLNPLMSLRANDSEKQRLYFENDPHFNLDGQLIMTKYIQEQIFSK
ncbi:hypothetical protein [Winogradskyella sp.]|uniref:hypothetical protein n=1 Tax=Winogradskyella sp. TaxID=1883156 RepID=UPI0025CD60CD|nr:hypothetical protein [Winogradskyella sp.]